MALMPDVTMILTDPELGAQEVTIRRRQGSWKNGRYIANTLENGETDTFTAIGNLQRASSEQLEVFPEGERKRETKVFYTKTMLYPTEGDKISDELYWHGHPYRIVYVDRWDDWGFCIAYAARRG